MENKKNNITWKKVLGFIVLVVLVILLMQYLPAMYRAFK